MSVENKEQVEIEYNKAMLEICDLASEDDENCIVECEGEFYYIGKDDEWPYETKLEYDVMDFEANYILATRRSVGTGTKTYSQQPYIFEKDLDDKDIKEIDTLRNVNRRWVASESQISKSGKAFLPDSDIGIYKELKEPIDMDGEHEIVYDTEADKYYCIRQCCPACNKDNVIIHKKQRDMRIISIDLSAQEPRCNIMDNPDEKTWRQVFQNDTLRKDPVLLVFLETLFKQHLKVNTDADLRYQEFIDKQYFLDHTKLYEFNNAVMMCKLEPNNIEAKAKLSSIIDEIATAWNDFIS